MGAPNTSVPSNVPVAAPAGAGALVGFAADAAVGAVVGADAGAIVGAGPADGVLQPTTAYAANMQQRSRVVLNMRCIVTLPF
jgi:hypothetical protein